jgi:ABC-type sugar transport system permease subunit
MGFGSAIGVSIFLVIMLVTVFNLRVLRRTDIEVV